MLADYRSAAIVMAHPAQAQPLLREAYRRADGDQRLLYAKALGMLGDATGLDVLLATLAEAREWDAVPDWRIRQDEPGFDQVGWSMSNLDNTLVAVGRTRRAEAVPPVLEKLAILTPESAFSHHRAVALALEWLGDQRAAKPLAELLRRPGVGGHAVTSIAERDTSDTTRSAATRELMLARALYRCGDWEQCGQKILEEYAKDLRGHLARHAVAVLAGGNGVRPPNEPR